MEAHEGRWMTGTEVIGIIEGVGGVRRHEVMINWCRETVEERGGA